MARDGYGFGNAVAMEWVKLRGLRSTTWVLAAGTVASIAMLQANRAGEVRDTPAHLLRLRRGCGPFSPDRHSSSLSGRW